jgi:hypothetical protein
MKPVHTRATTPFVFRALVLLYPPDFRSEFGPSILQLLRDQRRDLVHKTAWTRTRFYCHAFADLYLTALRERIGARRDAARSPAWGASPTTTPMLIAIFSILAALALGFGAVQEFIVRGLGNGEVEPGTLGVVAAIVCALMIFAAVAYARRAPYARPLLVVTGVFSLVVHGYGALPPHYVGRLALLVAVASAVVLIAAGLRLPKSQAQ